jgi:hypothetical protein
VPDLGAPNTKINEHHREFFKQNEPISERHGELLAAWARGGSGAGDTQHAPSSGASQRARETTESGSSATVPDLVAAVNLERAKMKPSAFVAVLGKHALSTGDWQRAPDDVLEALLRDLRKAAA